MINTCWCIKACTAKACNNLQNVVKACFSSLGNWAMDHPRFTMYCTSVCLSGVGVGINYLPVSDIVRVVLSIPWYLSAAYLAGIASCPTWCNSLVMSF